MSALNHAFLRAYAKQRDESSHTVRRTVERAAEPVELDDAPAPAPRPHARHASLAVDASTSTPAPAVAERNRPQVDHPLYVPRHDVPLPSRSLFAARVASPPPVYQPLPAAQPPAPAPTSPTSYSRPIPRKAPVELVPAWEVDTFHWPRSCEIAWDAAHEEFAGLGEQMVQVNEHGLRVLGVTSATAHEGRTTMAICLARAAAAQGLRVLLLDADLDNPQLAPALGIDVRHDWTEVLSEALPLDETAVASVADRLTLVPLLSGASGRANLLRTPQFSQFVGQLAAVCDLVIVDLPPLDSKCLPPVRPGRASPLDAAILVRDVRQTTVEQLREACRRLENLGIPSVGVIENFVLPV